MALRAALHQGYLEFWLAGIIDPNTAGKLQIDR
jgi:hypothetical protein